MLTVFDTLADYQLDNALYYFRQRIEEAFTSKTYRSRSVISERSHRGKNDSIFERLDTNFTFEQALQQSIAMKDLRDQLQPLVWISMPLPCLILVKKQ